MKFFIHPDGHHWKNLLLSGANKKLHLLLQTSFITLWKFSQHIIFCLIGKA
jgi:hypothetical protein